MLKGKSSRSEIMWAYAALVTGILVIGFSAIFVRLADVPGVVSAFYRLAIGALVMTPPFIWQVKRKKEKLPPRGIWLAAAAGVFFGLDLTAWTSGIMLSNATIPTLMANTAPLWVGLGALFFFRESQRSGFWLGLSLALVGAVVVLGRDLLDGTPFGIGAALGLVAALMYSAFFLVSQRSRGHLSTLSFFWISTTSSAVVLFIAMTIFGHSFTGYSLQTTWIFIVMGVVVQALGWMVVNYAQGHLPASLIAPSFLGQPIITALFAIPILGETFTIWHFVGGILVLAGVYLVHLSRNNKSDSKSPGAGS
ncbi:MAG: DMT family transporter [Chloroflexota bacterium]